MVSTVRRPWAWRPAARATKRWNGARATGSRMSYPWLYTRRIDRSATV